MADRINTAPADVPPLDTVVLWVTNYIERNCVARGVFPAVRLASAKKLSNAASLHYLRPADAEAMLADALQLDTMASLEPRGFRTACKAHIQNLRAAMQAAEERQAAFEATEAVNLYRSESGESWRGTKAQLQAIGIKLDGPWPGEEGGKRRGNANDQRGYRASITAFSAIWPGLYEARIAVPCEVWGEKGDAQDARTKDARNAKDWLDSMPKGADEFRREMLGTAQTMLKAALGRAVKPASWHGYTLDQEGADVILESFDAVVEAAIAARVHFDAKRHAEIEQGYRARMATGDDSFQSKLGQMMKPDPAIMAGGGQ